MALVDKIKGFLESEERTFEYACLDCEATFQSPHSDMSNVSCPECRSTDVTTASTSTA